MSVLSSMFNDMSLAARMSSSNTRSPPIQSSVNLKLSRTSKSTCVWKAVTCIRSVTPSSFLFVFDFFLLLFLGLFGLFDPSALGLIGERSSLTGLLSPSALGDRGEESPPALGLPGGELNPVSSPVSSTDLVRREIELVSLSPTAITLQ